jgi:hypothetical protein
MYLVILTTDQELRVINENDLESVSQLVRMELKKDTKESCENYLEELGYTGPVWNNCQKQE